MEQPKGPFCQSCSMPMLKPEDFGTDQHGWRINDYCYHCFSNGEFTHPGITMEEMIDIAVSHMAQFMPETKAKEIAGSCIPYLKRWKSVDKEEKG